MKKLSISQKIEKLLLKGKTITPLQALNQFDCLRLGARIHDLRKTGMQIETIDHRTPSGKHVAKYKLTES